MPSVFDQIRDRHRLGHPGISRPAPGGQTMPYDTGIVLHSGGNLPVLRGQISQQSRQHEQLVQQELRRHDIDQKMKINKLIAQHTTQAGKKTRDVNGDGVDDGITLPEVTVRAKRLTSSLSWQNFLKEVGPNGYNVLIDALYEAKLAPYKSNFSIAVYGYYPDGSVAIPDYILKREFKAAKEEAIEVLATMWSMRQSRQNPASLAWGFNLIGQAVYYNSYLQTGVTRETAQHVITSVGIETGSWYLGNRHFNPLKPYFKFVRAKASGKIHGFSVAHKKGYGSIERFDWHPLYGPSRKTSKLTVPKSWVGKVPLPHYHIEKGKNLHYHRPWELDPTGKRRW